jgi:hypothetical protein
MSASDNPFEQPEFKQQIDAMKTGEVLDLLDFANKVQAWSARGGRRIPRFGTFTQAAKHFRVPVERIALAVEAHYWMYANDPSAPIGERCIEHEGE